jgi:hypothetical protein
VRVVVDIAEMGGLAGRISESATLSFPPLESVVNSAHSVVILHLSVVIWPHIWEL